MRLDGDTSCQATRINCDGLCVCYVTVLQAYLKRQNVMEKERICNFIWSNIFPLGRPEDESKGEEQRDGGGKKGGRGREREREGGEQGR